MEKIERFFSEVFRDCDWQREKIAVATGYHSSGDYAVQNFKTTIYDNVKTLLRKFKMENIQDRFPTYAECYFSVATVKYGSQTKTTEDLFSRNCLVFDFDGVADATEIYERFKTVGLFCHCLINSGHGFHAYVFLDRRLYEEEFQQLQELNAYYVQKLQADPQANKVTQLLRIPGTFNCKDKLKRKKVVLVSLAEDIRPYNYDELRRQMNKKRSLPEIQKDFTDIPPCVSALLENGAEEGERNFYLKRLVSYFQKETEKTDENILNLAIRFGDNCKPPMNKNEVVYHTNYILNKEYNFFGCSNQDGMIQNLIDKFCDKAMCMQHQSCSNKIVQGDTIEDFVMILPERLCNFRKGGKGLNGNKIAILTVVSAYKEITNEKLREKLSDKDGRMICNERALNTLLKELQKQDLIIKNNGFWMVGSKLSKDMGRSILCSYHAVRRYIDSDLSKRALELYFVMARRLKNKQDCLQESLADELGVGQPTISKYIIELETNDFIIIRKDYTRNPQHPVNIYTLLM